MMSLVGIYAHIVLWEPRLYLEVWGENLKGAQHRLGQQRNLVLHSSLPSPQHQKHEKPRGGSSQAGFASSGHRLELSFARFLQRAAPFSACHGHSQNPGVLAPCVCNVQPAGPPWGLLLFPELMEPLQGRAGGADGPAGFVQRFGVCPAHWHTCYRGTDPSGDPMASPVISE